MSGQPLRFLPDVGVVSRERWGGDASSPGTLLVLLVVF